MGDCQWAKELIVTLYQRQRILRILLGAAGILVIAMLLWVYLSGLSLHCRNEAAFSWIETPCRIESVERQLFFNTRNSHPYEIQYRYSYDGSSYLSARFSIPRRYERAVDVLSKFAEDDQTVCYVNPALAEEAVLRQSSLVISDYVRHVFWPTVVLVVFLLVPRFIYKQCRVNQKQLRELITGQKENILAEMDRISGPLDEETLSILERATIKCSWGPFHVWPRVWRQ